MKPYLLLLVGLLFASPGHAQVIIDDFSGTSINTTLWTVSTPFADSSVTESGGDAIFDNRGRLLSTFTLPDDFTLSGNFAFTGSSYDHFRIVMYTNGVQAIPSGEFDGLTLQFGIQSDGGDTSNNIVIEEADFPSGVTNIGSATAPISIGTLYDFELTKVGDDLSLYFNNSTTPIITTTSTYTSVGDLLALYNREGGAAGSSISAGSQVELSSIAVIPEPKHSALLVSSFILVALLFEKLVNLNRRIKWDVRLNS